MTQLSEPSVEVHHVRRLGLAAWVSASTDDDALTPAEVAEALGFEHVRVRPERARSPFGVPMMPRL